MKFKNKIFIISLIMLVLLSISFASAAQNDTLQADDSDEILSSADDIEEVSTSADDEVQTKSDNDENIGANHNEDVLSQEENAYYLLGHSIYYGDNITLNSDYAYKDGVDDKYILINKDVTINGNGHYISGKGIAGVFKIVNDGVTLRLNNITFKDARSDNGAVIHTKNNNVNIYITNCQFINNEAYEDAGAIYTDTSENSKLDIRNSLFENCSVHRHGHRADGGAVKTYQGDVYVDGCTFRTCLAEGGYGGAVYIGSECSGVKNSVFENNKATQHSGAAIYVDHNTMGIIVENCNFTGNNAHSARDVRANGGAIYYDGSGVTRLLNCNFIDNHAWGESDDPYVGYNTRNINGGAVGSDHSIEIGNCYFLNNSAIDLGGAVYCGDAITWLDTNSVFINNSVSYKHQELAKKGGAVYAGTFKNDAKGLTFINNHATYGGAVYINNQCEVTFESCLFKDNYGISHPIGVASKISTTGAAIYMDSAASKLSLFNNIFVNNHADEDNAVYTCGVFVKIANNWFGTNNPNFKNDKYLVEWHRIGSNDIRADNNHLKLRIMADKYDVFETNVTVTAYFVDCDGDNFTGKLTGLNGRFFSDISGDEFLSYDAGDNKLTTVVSVKEASKHLITAQVDNQKVSITLNQKGNFTWLQEQISAADGVYNLTRDLIYSYGIDNKVEGIEITKPIRINGNGHTLDGVGFARIFNIQSDDVVIDNITLVNARDSFGIGGGAIFINGANNVVINNSRFTNNAADRMGGAIYSKDGNDLTIMNCQFTDNYNREYGNGAVSIETPNSKIINTIFKNNHAERYAGALGIYADNITIDHCEFTNNSASGMDFSGAAINSIDENLTISNSIFLNNKGLARNLKGVFEYNSLVLSIEGYNNYINAISSDYNIKFSNVTYWDGEITTGNAPLNSSYASGISIVLEIFNNAKQLVKKVNLTTDKNGRAIFDCSNLPNGNYTFRAIHFEDSYYTYAQCNSKFNISRDIKNSSAVDINIPDGKLFNYGDCTISFEVTNGTEVEIYIIDEDSNVLYDGFTNSSSIIVDLSASDKYYYILVYNWGNATYDPSWDYKSFKILKIDSTIELGPVSNITYGSNLSVAFDADCTSYNVTVYDMNNEIVFSKIIDERTLEIPGLGVGAYNVTVINLGNENKTQSKASTTFNVNKAKNNFKVEVTNGTYAYYVTITVTADVDGQYTVKINTQEIMIEVIDGAGSKAIDTLPAGNHAANVTFANGNYINNATNSTFTIQKAQSNVTIIDLENITWNYTKNIRFADFYPASYNVTIYDRGNNIVCSELINSIIYTVPILDAGQYNMTVTNLGSENIIGSQDSVIFNVVKENHVEVLVEDSNYGREVFIGILADVDGYYTVDINGTEVTIEVADGEGIFYGLLDLNAGNYTTKVIFDNPDYATVVNNTNFTVYQAESNIQIYEIGNVTYGEDVYINFYDDYPTTFLIEIYAEDTVLVANTTFEYSDKRKDMTVIFSDLEVGKYTVVITNLGNDNVIYNFSSRDFNVTKATPAIEVIASNVVYPDDVVVLINTTATGNYTVKLGNQTQSIVLKAGEMTQVVFKDLSANNYQIDVTYKETANYNSAVKSINVTVAQNNEFDIDIETNKIGNDTELTISFPKDAKGNVTVFVNGKDYYYTNVTNGTATVLIKNLTDDDEIEVIYSGDENYPSKQRNTTNALLYSNIAADDMNRGYNSGMDYQVILLDKNGKAIANATLTFTINGKTYTAVSDANGVARINPKLAVGTYTVNVANPFNKQNVTKTLKIVTRITGNKNVNTYYGKNYQYKLRIIGDDGKVAGKNIAVKVTVNGKAQTLKTDKNGYITVKFTKNYLPKTYTVTAEYKGVKVSNKVKVKKVLTLKKVKVKRSAKKLVLKATLKEGKKALKGKKVVFKFKGKKYTAKTNKKGIAKVTIKKKVLQKLKKGKNVKYQATYLKHTVKLTAKVKR